MVFTSLRLRNLKCYKDTGKIRLSPLTIIVGPNNAGKSTLLQSILLLKQTLEDKALREPLITAGRFGDFGSYFDILRGGREAEELAIRIDLSITRVDARQAVSSTGSPSRAVSQAPTQLELDFGCDRQTGSAHLSSLRIADDGVPILRVLRKDSVYAVEGLTPSAHSALDVDFNHFLPQFTPKFATAREKSLGEILHLFRLASFCTRTWTRALREVSYVAPLRVSIPRYAVVGSMAATEMDPGGENLLRVLSKQEKVRGTHRTLEEWLRYWTAERFRLVAGLRLVKVDQDGLVVALVGDESTGFKGINVASAGKGLSQLLPILANVLTTRDGQCLLIEQPELHLHPAAQATLADLFIENLGKGRRQYIVETHSEHLLMRVRTRIAEGKLDSSDVSILFVRKGVEQSEVSEVRVKPNGQLENWPEGFFEEAYNEAWALAEANPPAGTH